MDLNIWFVVILAVTGLIAGVINTLAGGGSNLTLPALMMMGLPADVANATNRVGVIMQSVVGIRGFSKRGHMPTSDLKGIMVPILSGGLIGSVVASFLPTTYLKPVLLLTMISMSIIILIRPSTVLPEPDELPKKVAESKQAWVMLFIAGLYGGFVQAGVGFVLIAAIAGGLRYDLIKTNALKILATFAFTSVALAVFIFRGQISWVPGLILAGATMIGAQIGVKLALKVSQKFMKWFLFFMTLAASIGAML